MALGRNVHVNAKNPGGVEMGEKIWGLSKAASHYKPAPKPSVRCDACRYMFPRLPVGSCKLVRGLIKGSYTCDEFLPAGGRKG